MGQELSGIVHYSGELSVHPATLICRAEIVTALQHLGYYTFAN